jgi:hypothetical protein
VKYLNTYKIFEEKVDWNTIVDIFLYRSFEDLIDTRSDIEISHKPVTITDTSTGGIYIEFREDKKTIKLYILNIREHFDVDGNSRNIFEKSLVDFKEELSSMGLNVKWHDGLIRSPYDFGLIFAIKIEIS